MYTDYYSPYDELYGIPDDYDYDYGEDDYDSFGYAYEQARAYEEYTDAQAM